MFCVNCGHQLQEGANFCPQCGNKTGAAPIASTPVEAVSSPVEEQVVLKSKKDFIYERFCLYMKANPLIAGFNPNFGELENYEEGANGMVYCELVATTRNMLGKTNKVRFGAVVEAVEADGNVVFKGAGPQLVTPLTGSKLLKKVLGFKAK